MKISSERAIIIVLIVVIAILSLILIQSQNTINSQRATIATQQQKISELEGEVAKLSEITPDKILNDAKALIKDQGVSIFQSLTQKAIQEIQNK